jgi:hypothetical protein
MQASMSTVGFIPIVIECSKPFHPHYMYLVNVKQQVMEYEAVYRTFLEWLCACERYGKWLLSSLGCYSDDNDMPLLQLYENISSIYFLNYV